MKKDYLRENYDSLSLKKLPLAIKKNGFDYKLIKRSNEKCIYSQCDGNRIVAYEVFKTKVIENRERLVKFLRAKGKEVNPDELEEYKEIFPSDEEFGTRAWTYPTIEFALKKYEGLN